MHRYLLGLLTHPNLPIIPQTKKTTNVGIDGGVTHINHFMVFK